MAVEFELKFRATPEQLDKVEQGISGARQVMEMETTYYDTADGALSERKYTLRRRMENGVSVCTLKTPVGQEIATPVCELARNDNGGCAMVVDPVISEGDGFLATLEMTEEETIPSGERWERRRGRIQRPERVAAVGERRRRSRQGEHRVPQQDRQEGQDEHHARGVTGDSPGRGEYEVCCERIEDAIPELCKLSGVGLRDLTAGGVVKVAGARFTRVASTVVLPECTVEIALDRGVLLGGGREIPLCEMEVELKSGSREAAALYAVALAKTYGLTPEKFSKFRRALDLARGK